METSEEMSQRRAESRSFSSHLLWHFAYVLSVTAMLSMTETSTKTSRLSRTDSALVQFVIHVRSEYEESWFVPDVDFSSRMSNTDLMMTASANLCRRRRTEDNYSHESRYCVGVSKLRCRGVDVFSFRWAYDAQVIDIKETRIISGFIPLDTMDTTWTKKFLFRTVRELFKVPRWSTLRPKNSIWYTTRHRTYRYVETRPDREERKVHVTISAWAKGGIHESL